jgi:CheY-like chemotaxis protein
MIRISTICIVDDDQVYQITTKKMLQRIASTNNILVFSDGTEAFQYLSEMISNKDALPDVIFLDINMPLMNAWEFLDAYAEIKPHLPKSITIYVISSSISDTDIERARQIEHVKDYFVKPITMDQYETMLQTA